MVSFGYLHLRISLVLSLRPIQGSRDICTPVDVTNAAYCGVKSTGTNFIQANLGDGFEEVTPIAPDLYRIGKSFRRHEVGKRSLDGLYQNVVFVRA